MWTVETAIRRPYTFVVMALLILLAAPFVLWKMPTDLLPEVDIPVISIVWSYDGLSAQEMADRIAAGNERGLTTAVSNIDHIESQSLAGVAVIKVFFQPKANLQTAIAQVVAMTQYQLKQMPPGMRPPLIIRYSASSVPVVQLGVSSKTMPEQDVFDAAVINLRPQLVTIPGVAVPYPYGGKISQINVDLDIGAMQARGLTPADVVNAVNAQNLALPAGTVKMGDSEHTVALNGSVDTLAALGELPVRGRNGAIMRLSELGHVRDGFAPQTNVVRQNGQRGALLTVLKNGVNASTVEIVDRLRSMLPAAMDNLPKDVQVTPLFDQSRFVKAAISGVVTEGVLAACLASALILLFLGAWRSTLIIALSIPLSVLSSILLLYAMGETLNLMTLGGLALAVGILVDDATVTMENIERHLQAGMPLKQAVRTGVREIAGPTFVSTTCICIVFLPMFFLSGVARFLFVPMAEAVIFAVGASYVLSRTLLPALMILFPAPSHGGHRLSGIHQRFMAAFETGRLGYRLVLTRLLVRRKRFMVLSACFCLVSLSLVPLLGRDFFPEVDAGQIRLHMRMPSGARIEETVRMVDRVEALIRTQIPPDQLQTIVDNAGLPNSGINLSYSNSGTVGAIDAEILIALSARHGSTARYVAQLREVLPQRFPGVEFFFQPADMVSQVLNFGLPAAINVQFSGRNMVANMELANRLKKDVAAIPGAVDVHVQQRLDQPALRLTMDRPRLMALDVDPASVAQSVLVSLSGSYQTAPAYWLNPKNGVVNNIVVQAPQHRIDSVDSLLRLPVRKRDGEQTQPLGTLVTASPDRTPAVVSRNNLKPVVDVYVSVAGRDLSSVAADVEQKMAALASSLPRGTTMTMRGQIETMRASFSGLLLGVAVALLLVYLLVVVCFHSWLDALIVVLGLPVALAGIVWMLFITHTTLSVPALTGAVMVIGVASANAILVVSFARLCLRQGMSPVRAALEAAFTRVRPVLMTALAMLAGMLPMALGIGDGAEQNMPLGRAMIGGLLFATISTLFLVPVLFAALHGTSRARDRAPGVL